MKRKMISLFVICLLLTQFYVPGAVQAAVTDQINVLKELFKIPSGARLERENYDGAVLVTWTFKQQDGEEAGGYASFKAETGELLYYEEEYDSARLSVEITPAGSQKYIENIISRMLPGKKSKVRLVENPDTFNFGEDTYYSFIFQRYEGDVPVYGNYLSFWFNASTGRITGFTQEWHEGSLPARSGIISTLEAGNIFTGRVPLQLEWMKIPAGQGDLNFDLKPVYRKLDTYYGVNAVTGELIELTNLGNTVPFEFDATRMPKNFSAVSPENKISESDAVSIAKAKVKMPAKNELAVSYANWNWGEQGRTWKLVFRGGEDPNTDIEVEIDMVTGQVINIIDYNYYNSLTEDGTVTFDFNSGKLKAENYLKSLAPDEFSEMKLVQQDPGSGSSYQYVRYIYGIPYMENRAEIFISEFTGELVFYRFTWERSLNIPQLTNIIDLKQMRSIWAQNAEMQLVYWVEPVFDEETLEYNDNVQLIYLPKDSMLASYDAVTGETVQVGRIPKGTAGHWAEADFRFLAEKGIISADTAVSPDKLISRAEFTKMLVLATYLPPREVQTPTFSDVTLSNPYIGYIEQAYARGIVKGTGGQFLPDKPIARQEVAVILVKALKSEGRVDPQIEIQETGFKDRNLIASWASQDVKLAAQLGYIKGSNGYFKPVNSITWAEAAALISNYISEEGH